MALQAEERDRLRRLFTTVANDPTAGTPIYAAIGQHVADSYPTLDLYESLEARKHRPVTLFAAVHYLVLKGYEHKLASIYGTPESKDSLAQAGRAFVDFCSEYSDDVIRTMRTRYVQTNEVNRSIGLMPALMEVARQARRPLALVELGASAGLNLNFDRYRYDFVGGPVLGSPGAQVRLSTQLRGHVPKIDSSPPLIDYRVGIDGDPVDINDDDEELWLRGCLWVGEVAREQRLTAAMDLARREWPNVKEGDALTDIPKLLEDIDSGPALVFYNSWMMSWWPRDEQERLAEILQTISTQRELWWVTYEARGQVPGLPETEPPPDGSILGLQHMDNGLIEATELAHVHHHGAWLDWLDPSTTAW